MYFATKTRQMEILEQESADRKRLTARDKVTKAFKAVSEVAQSAGVQNRMQAVFHGGRFQGLYNMSRAEITAAKVSAKTKTCSNMPEHLSYRCTNFK